MRTSSPIMKERKSFTVPPPLLGAASLPTPGCFSNSQKNRSGDEKPQDGQKDNNQSAFHGAPPFSTESELHYQYMESRLRSKFVTRPILYMGKASHRKENPGIKILVLPHKNRQN